jgi:hypothetical protein
MLQPTFKQAAVHRTAKRKWRDNFVSVLCGDNADSRKTPAKDFTDYLFSAKRIAIFSKVIFIEAAFIRII